MAIFISSPSTTGAAEQEAPWQRVSVKRAGISFEVPGDWSVEHANCLGTKKQPRVLGVAPLVVCAGSPETLEGISPAGVVVFIYPGLAGFVTNLAEAKELAVGKIVNSRVLNIGRLRVFQVDSREVDKRTVLGRVVFSHRLLAFEHGTTHVTIRILVDKSRYIAATDLPSHVVESLKSV
jgi:hypothetical protein